MNIPDKKTDREDNRDARSFLKTRIQAESAGFFNGLLAEAGVVIHDEFREGNTAPASRNLEFIKDRETHLPKKGHYIAHVRLDSAGYQ